MKTYEYKRPKSFLNIDPGLYYFDNFNILESHRVSCNQISYEPPRLRERNLFKRSRSHNQHGIGMTKNTNYSETKKGFVKNAVVVGGICAVHVSGQIISDIVSQCS